MVEGIVFLFKGVVLVDVLTRAATEWGVFQGPRARVRGWSGFLDRLLGCFECTSVWVGGVVVVYLLWFEVAPLTYVLIFSRLAHVFHVLFNYLDAARAVKEGQV